jgi:hypothetical protein
MVNATIDVIRITCGHDGTHHLDSVAWPRHAWIGESVIAEFGRGPDLVDFRLANARGIYRITERGEDGIAAAELVYEEWYL